MYMLIWFVLLSSSCVNSIFIQTTCNTSKTEKGEGDRGKLNFPCQFPFIHQGRTYYTCTYDDSYVTGYKPWCSTKTDKFNNHIPGGNFGICDDYESCRIPPRFCGEPESTRPLPDNDIDSEVTVSQMPWMVSLGGFLSTNFWEHQCGGSLITKKHVLTAAHCFSSINENYLGGYTMRLGVTDLFIVNEGIKRRVAEYKTHPKYQGRAYFDVGIAVADKIIEFNARIMPICLPMRPVDDTDALANDFVNLAGWGLSINSQGKYELDAKMKLANLQVNSKELCGGIFNNKSLDARSLQRQIPNGFTSDITCVGNSFDVKEGACDGDSGSPVIKRIIGTARGKPYFEQHFIVSTGIDCKLEATIYARVTNRRILNWIQQVTETTPVLMVAGGYSDFNEYGPGLTNDIEIIAGKDKRACSKAVRPLEGELIELEDDYGAYYADSASAVGITGYFVKDAPILCGGKNAQDNLNACFEMDLKTNEWFPIPSMIEKRHGAASVIDENGNLWVLGGTYDSKSADSTEIYDYKSNGRGTWKQSYPLPGVLRDTGLDSHCAVRINSSHVFMAGGYARNYTFCDQLADDNCQEKAGKSVDGGGRVLKRAWMYNGETWLNLPSMSIPRDRPACSLIQLNDDSISVLVAGGCIDWCDAGFPGVTSAEMFDPEIDKWTKVADLPVALNSAKMELLDGLPTIVGGFDGQTQNGILYQYHHDLDEWIPHPETQMRKPRSSASVYQVPRQYFPSC